MSGAATINTGGCADAHVEGEDEVPRIGIGEGAVQVNHQTVRQECDTPIPDPFQSQIPVTSG